MIRTFTELSRLTTIEDRFDYLAIGGSIGVATFGNERYLNQQFYTSTEWRRARSYVITRDFGGDLGLEEFIIRGSPIVHHMNPITVEDIEERTPNLFEPEFLVCCSLLTHNAVHYGDKSQLPRPFVERRPGDTKFW